MADETESVGEARAELWNDDVAGSRYPADTSAAQATLLDQYKVYVEMADRVSQRRGLANTFFLTINTSIFTAVGIFWKGDPGDTEWWLVFPLIAVLGQCGAWFYLLRSYRLLNSAKFLIVGLLEERLPASPYAAEWTALGKGEDFKRYWPLSHIEKWVPILFAVAYLCAYLTLQLN